MPTLPKFEDHSAQEKKFTTCYMCACRCGVEVTVEDNKVRFVRGNPNHPVNKGVLCAKGNAAIMKQESPAKLKQPMMRRPGSERGTGDLIPISWDEALDMLTERLKKIRETDPKKFAFFTGRDQMQAFTGMWAQQFGTINWAAHGGFCSVNMAAAGLYSIGQSFWEFGDPDWDNTKYFMLWGVAEDHASNPMKIGIGKVKANGGKFVSINPVRTGYSAVADEWVPIRPGRDGLLALSMVHVLLSRDLFDQEFLANYTNASCLVVNTPGVEGNGLMLRDGADSTMVWDLASKTCAAATQSETIPALFGEYHSADGRPVKTVMTLVAEAYLDERYAPANVAVECGLSADTIERLALEMAHVAFNETITIPGEWVDTAGRTHTEFVGRPVSMHAMRGVSAHSNGFQSCRSLHMLQMMLGTIDVPGGHLAKPPFPRHIPPAIKPASHMAPNTPLSSPPLGFPTSPEDLVLDENGEPKRIDKAYSWEAPIANHGMMHRVIGNAVRGDPYTIDTLMLFMANMAWNSSMDTSSVMDMLREKDESGEYKLPFLVVADAFDSETVKFADLVLPDTTYLERHDVISILDRPISEPHAVCDSVRIPVLKPDRDVRPFQEVLLELGERLGFPAFVDDEGKPKFKGYADFTMRWEKAPGIGFMGGWRGVDGTKAIRGEPNPDQWKMYEENQCFFEHKLPENQRYYRFANRDYLNWSKEVGFVATNKPIIMELYSETLQKFRLAGQGLYDGPQPPEELRERVVEYFDPLPNYLPPLEETCADTSKYPFHAVNQRPMFMYHSWDSQNAWLRQIMTQNYLYMNRAKGEEMDIKDLSWVWVESRNGKVRAQVKLMEGCQKDTVWTWNAIGKKAGAWGLDPKAPEATRAFLLNHVIPELLPSKKDIAAMGNADPITGQAAWYDLRVKITPAGDKDQTSYPQFDSVAPRDAVSPPESIQYHTHKPVGLKRKLADILGRK